MRYRLRSPPLTLGAGWASLVAGWSAACYGLLISWHLEELVPAHHRLVDFPTHLFTMCLAIATLGELAAHFVGAASRAVARREAELDLMRQRRHAPSIWCHSRRSPPAPRTSCRRPLATIAIASKELERALARTSVPAGCTADARLIRRRSGSLSDHPGSDERARRRQRRRMPEAVRIWQAVMADVKARLTADLADRPLTWRDRGPADPSSCPAPGLVQVLLSLLKNAFDATAARSP